MFSKNNIFSVFFVLQNQKLFLKTISKQTHRTLYIRHTWEYNVTTGLKKLWYNFFFLLPQILKFFKVIFKNII